jgi:LysM repeat protein
LTIPLKGHPARPAEVAKAELRTGTSTEPKTAPQNYTVKSGDRLLFIAKRFNVSPDELVALNKLKDPGKLQAGQTLKIPAKKSP